MAFSSSIPTGGVQRSGRNKRVRYNFTNGTSDSGGTIDTGFAYIQEVAVKVTSHYNAAEPKITESAPNVTIQTSDGADGYVIVEGRGYA